MDEGNQMVERVAKAIGDHFYADVRPDTTPELWASCLDAARAAIEAMREPTAEMVAAVGSDYGAALEATYQAMIDAALTPPPSGEM
jgi:hypothetical protein